MSAALAVAGCVSVDVTEVVPSAPLDPLIGALADFPQAPISPPLPTGPLQTIVIASCMNQDWSRDQVVLNKMTETRADLAILMGDNVYGSDTPDDPLLSDLRAAYWKQARRREFTGLVSTTPTLAVWDDHDFGKNDGGGADFTGRALAQKMFDAFWRIGPDHPQGHDDGVYGGWIIGPPGQRTQILLLDTRYNRSPLKPTDQRAPGKERYIADLDPAKTMLGAAQWAWLEGELKKPAELRLIVTSVQVVAEGHGWEKWGNLPLEKQRLYDLIGRTQAKGVVILSGDRHYASIAKEPAGPAGYPLYDFTASAVNMPWGAGEDETVPQRITPGMFKENFGVVQVDWAGRTVTLALRDKEAKPVFTETVAFGAIGIGR